MKTHQTFEEMLPEYVAGSLPLDEARAFETHLLECDACQADLAFWREVSGGVAAQNRAIEAPPDLAERVLVQIRKPENKAARPAGGLMRWGRRAFNLMRVQAPMVSREIWPASALVNLLGYIVVLVSGRAEALEIIAPLVAAACMAVIYGPEHDPAMELTSATPTAPGQIFLARLSLVFGYNLGLALLTSLALLPWVPGLMLDQVVISWLAPMAFLSSLALLLSMMIHANNALALVYTAWLLRFMASGVRENNFIELRFSEQTLAAAAVYQQFWQNSSLLLVLSVVLVMMAVWLAGKQESTSLHLA
jgi:hypothetical protein